MAALHLLLSHRDPRQRSFPVQVRESRAQQPHFRGGVSEVNVAGAVCRIRARQYQITRQLEGVFVRSFKHERTRIGQNGGIETGRDLGRNFHTGFSCQTVHHLRRGDRLGINPVDVCERAATQVVINVDQETALQPQQPRTLDTVTLQDDRCSVLSVHALGLDNLLRERQRLVNTRHPIA